MSNPVYTVYHVIVSQAIGYPAHAQSLTCAVGYYILLGRWTVLEPRANQQSNLNLPDEVFTFSLQFPHWRGKPCNLKQKYLPSKISFQAHALYNSISAREPGRERWLWLAFEVQKELLGDSTNTICSEQLQITRNHKYTLDAIRSNTLQYLNNVQDTTLKKHLRHGPIFYRHHNYRQIQ